MTTMIREVYEALKEAGATEDKAAAAAEAASTEKFHVSVDPEYPS